MWGKKTLPWSIHYILFFLTDDGSANLWFSKHILNVWIILRAFGIFEKNQLISIQSFLLWSSGLKHFLFLSLSNGKVKVFHYFLVNHQITICSCFFVISWKYPKLCVTQTKPLLNVLTRKRGVCDYMKDTFGEKRGQDLSLCHPWWEAFPHRRARHA